MSKLYDIIDNAQVASHYDEAALQAVREVKALMLEVIGEDAKFENVYQWHQEEPLNLLRAELRKKIESL